VGKAEFCWVLITGACSVGQFRDQGKGANSLWTNPWYGKDSFEIGRLLFICFKEDAFQIFWLDIFLIKEMAGREDQFFIFFGYFLRLGAAERGDSLSGAFAFSVHQV